MTRPIRLRVTAVAEYDADPEDYGTDIPEEMATIDLENFRREHWHLNEVLRDDRVSLTVEGFEKEET